MTELLVHPDILEKYKDMFFGRYAVLLHNDDNHEFSYVMESITKAVPGLQNVGHIVMTAHKEGQAVVIICMKEVAELYQERIQSFGLASTIEPE